MTFVHAVLRLLLIPAATIFVVSKDGNILPWSRVPVRIVIFLFLAFKSVTSSAIVLTRILSVISVQVTVSNKQTLVTFTSFAFLEPVQRFVEAVFVTFATIGFFVVVFRDLVSRSAITNQRFSWSIVRATHVLQNDSAISVFVTTSVLIGPFDSQPRSFVVFHHFRANIDCVTTLGIVLRIKHSLGVLTIGVTTIQTIVGTTRVMHVNICKRSCDNCQ
mmetsp:Transcript_18927/g.32661  ORF Transcript_18927/g.32661 Transcript_18927/m.32661 type:complete len:218 (+) Transcript_18927:1271-1924(+)